MRKRMVDCPKCYGEGTYMLPVTYFSKKWERRTCDLCNGTGKIDKDYYDRLMGNQVEKRGIEHNGGAFTKTS